MANFDLTRRARRMFGIPTEGEGEKSQDWVRELEADTNHMTDVVKALEKCTAILGEALKQRNLVEAARQAVLISDGIKLLREVCGLK